MIDRTNKDEAIVKLLDKQINNNQDKLSHFLAQDNVKAFNRAILSRAFCNNSDASQFSYDDPGVCQHDCIEFFDLCYKHDIIPSVASLAVYLHNQPSKLVEISRNKNHPSSKVIRDAINICHSIQENGALHGTINNFMFAFMGKNYYGLSDKQEINVNSVVQDTTVNNIDTLKIIQEQLALENKDNM